MNRCGRGCYVSESNSNSLTSIRLMPNGLVSITHVKFSLSLLLLLDCRFFFLRCCLCVSQVHNDAVDWPCNDAFSSNTFRTERFLFNANAYAIQPTLILVLSMPPITQTRTHAHAWNSMERNNNVPLFQPVCEYLSTFGSAVSAWWSWCICIHVCS